MRNSFTAFVVKEVLHILRDRRTMAIALLIPLVQMILFGFAISTEVNDIEIYVAAADITPGVEAKVSQLSHNPYVTFKGYVPTDAVDNTLRSNKALAVVVFDNRFDSHGGAQIALDASNTTTAQTAASYLQSIIAGTDTPGAPGVTILFNPQLRSAYNFVPGIMGMIFILLCAMLTSVSIVREKETGTMETLLVSPVRPGMIVVAKMIPYFILTCLDLAIILTVAKYALELPLSGSMTALLTVSFVYIILSLALGLLISTIVSTQMAALLISGMVLMMPIIMLSGMMFPVENMPVALQWVSAAVPARWYIPAMRKIMVEGLGFSYVAYELAILSGMTAVLITLSVKRFKNRLQ